MPQNVQLVRSPAGAEYYYYQASRGTEKAGPRARIVGVPYKVDGTPNEDWWAQYRALEGLELPSARAGTLQALVEAREASGEWAGLSENTRKEWTRYHRVIVHAWGNQLVKALEPQHVMALRDQYADIAPVDVQRQSKPLAEYKHRPAAANNLLRALSAMISWSIPRGWRTDNPCDHVPKIKTGAGYSPWPMRAIEFYEKHGKPHLFYVAAVALYTGQRQSDVLGMLKSDIADGMIRVKQDKTGRELWVPIHRDLATVLAAMREARGAEKTPRLSRHLLVNSLGSAWTSDGFKSSWATEMERREFRAFRRHRLVFHGLRKSSVVMLLEAGCTEKEVSSITGQSLQMVEHYSKQVNQQKMARAAMRKWELSGGRTENG